jgi:predicted TPR repeat methyltransferase
MSLSVDKALRKAKSHIKAGDLVAAEELYKQILSKFPKNKKAIQGYQELKAEIASETSSSTELPQEQVDQLNELYSQGKHSLGQMAQALVRAEMLTQKYPKAFWAWNILGAANKGLGKIAEASDAFKRVTELNPNYADGFSNLGLILCEQGKPDEALEILKKALHIKPDHATAKHLIASIIGKTPKSPPKEYVEELFNEYAAKFEVSLVEKLEYRAPKIIADMIIKRHHKKALGSVLDLGCGTGLAGLELKQFCQNLEGIDLSKSMLEEARSKSVYDNLIHGDIVEYLSEVELNFDYFISADVFIYVGDLSNVFRLIKSKNNRQGKLVFSTEHTEREGFHLEKSGRYSHSKNYIKGLCNKYGYYLAQFEKIKLRKDKGEFIIGGLYFLDFDPSE